MLKTTKFIEAFIDGASLGNPGNSGVGVIIYQANKPAIKLKKYIGHATNNIAEYSALIFCLREAKKLNFLNLKLFTDSELLYRQLIGKYKVRDENLKELFRQAQEHLKLLNQVEISHIPREKNKEADKLAKQAAEEAQVIAPKFRGGKSELQREA